jgi:hypothetical protein
VKALRTIKRNFLWVIPIAGIFAFFCANPVDEPPLKWRSKMQLPVTNDTFYLPREMNNLFGLIKDNKVEILKSGISKNYPGKDYVNDPNIPVLDTLKGDTAVFSVLRNDTATYVVSQDSMKAKLYHPVIGAIPIKGASEFIDTLPLPSGPFNNTVSFPLERVYQITFDSSSPAFSLMVTNVSNADIPNLIFTIFGSTQNTGGLAPGGTATLLFPIALETVADSLPVVVTGNATAVASLEFRFNLNGPVASYLRVHHSLVSFDTVFHNNYDLTDTLAVDYIDIASGQFNYRMRNNTGMDLEVMSLHEHLWTIDYCEALHTIERFEDIGASNPTYIDSMVHFYGLLTDNGYKDIWKSESLQILKSNLSQCRLFPEWDTIARQSISRVTYYVRKNPLQRDSIVTISKGDSLLFIIEAPLFKFEEMVGTVMEPYVGKGDTQTVAIPFPWNKESKDSLRNRLILEEVYGDIFLKTNVPGKSSIDSFDVSYSIWPAVNPPQAKCTSSTRFVDVVDEKQFRHKTDITNIVNLWPDSAYLTADVRIPRGTRIRAVNDLLDRTDPDYNKFMGRMTIKGITDVRMNAQLRWRTIDTANLDLGTGRFPVPGALRFFNKMERRKFSYNLSAYNNTNVYMKIYALFSPYGLIDSLYSMSVNETWRLIQDTALARSQGYVSFLGPKGITIPPRREVNLDTVALNDWQIGQILGSDTCGWRWQARFLPKASDALHDTDYIKVNSWMHIEGDNNMDSLLIWKKGN